MTANAVDLAVIVVYLLGVAGLGIALRGRQEGVGDYFLGSRRIAWPLILMSIVSTETSVVTFLSVPGRAFAGDMTFLQLPLGYIVGRLGVAIFLMPLFFRGQSLTLYEMLGRRFGPGVQRLNSVLFIITRSIADGLRLYLLAQAVQVLTGWSESVSIGAVGAATIVYTLVGGMRGVVWTDFALFFTYLLGALVAGWILLGRIDGGWRTVWDVGSAAGKFEMLNFSFDLTVSYTFWVGLLGGAFLTAATHGADQLMVQRYLCTDSVGHARLALVSSGVVVLVQFAVFLLLGVGLFAYYEQVGLAPIEPDKVFMRFIVNEVPPGIRGLVIAAVFSAAMGSSLNSVASAAVADLYRPVVKPRESESHYLGAARAFTVIAGLLQMAVAFYGQMLPGRSTVDQVLNVAAFTTGITLGVVLLGVVSRRASGTAAGIGMLLGAVMVTCVWALTPVAGLWYALYGSIVTLLTGLAASYALPQNDHLTNSPPIP